MLFRNNENTVFDFSITYADKDINILLENNFDSDFEVTLNAIYVRRYSLAYLSRLKRIYMPFCEGVETYSFTRSAVEEIILPECEKIEANAFSNCNDLEILSIPAISNLNNKIWGNSMDSQLDDLVIFQRYPYVLGMDKSDYLTTAWGIRLTISIDENDADFEEALDYILSLEFDEFVITNSEGEIIEV